MERALFPSLKGILHFGDLGAFNWFGDEGYKITFFQRQSHSNSWPWHRKNRISQRQKKQSHTLETIMSLLEPAERHVKMSGPIIESLIQSYGSIGKYQDAIRVFQSIEGTTDEPCLSAILYVCSIATPVRWEDAVFLLHVSDIVVGSQGRGQVEMMALSYAVVACAKENEWEEGLKLLELYGRPTNNGFPDAMNNNVKNIHPFVSVDAINSFIAAAGRSGRPDVAVKLLNEMSMKFSVMPNERSYRSCCVAINQAEHEKRRQRTKRALLKGEGEQSVLDYGDEEDEDDDPLSLQWWEVALSLLRRMKEDGLTPDAQTFSSVISSCEAAGQWQRALGILRSMSFDGKTPPNLFCFNAAISACEKAGAWLESVELYERIRAKGGAVKPNFITVNSILIALDNAGQRNLAENMYMEAVSDGIVSPWKWRLDADGKKVKAMVSIYLLV